MTTQQKLAKLEEILRRKGRLIVAYSGGVDSTFLAVVAGRVLGERTLAVTAKSPSLREDEYAESLRLAREFGFRHRVIETGELEDPNYARNWRDRCYHCKAALMEKLAQVAAEEGGACVALGATMDDLGDYRPGESAARERGACFPLREAEMTKEDVRELSRRLGLPTWNKPAAACLSSRIAYGMAVTVANLAQVGQAEMFLKELGFVACRVRHHGQVARLEVPPEDITKLCQPDLRRRIVARLKELGFTFVAVDLQGYRQGAMNEALAPSDPEAEKR